MKQCAPFGYANLCECNRSLASTDVAAEEKRKIVSFLSVDVNYMCQYIVSVEM